jgi:hypothetical protein
MAYGLVGLYGLYFILVGYQGNAKALMANIQEDGKSFVPWILAILVLRAMYSSETLRPMVKPFIVLAALTFVLRNYATVAGQLNQLLPANVKLPP